MISDALFYTLLVVGVVWLYLMRHWVWPYGSCTPTLRIIPLASKLGKMPPSQPVLEGARPWSRIFFTTNSPYSFSCGSSSCCTSLWSKPGLPTPPVPAKPKRNRSNEPKAFEGLTQKPHCALCEQETADPHHRLLYRPIPCPQRTDVPVPWTPRCTFVPTPIVTIAAGWG